ncbi:MAG TPA: hypothetical protein PKE49_18945 [Leptospiraceae bacterium]|jgi:hypothetical protein|nr:hypothetical protein [Leptospirales bacterium]HMU84071.1 hypothetical protein [Leptospiraceae bacterium]HMW61857.1 hypothetical protein [Leptospiraceae bacterium]HMX58614.1 hypothetical protein [Leptospiraceae bacterium]HMY45327.1 hypothetical protein [Leptospiraceae bacterium]
MMRLRKALHKIIRFSPAILLGLSWFCIPRPAKTDVRWKPVLSLPRDAAIMQLRTEGAQDLLVYSGVQDGLSEIGGATDLLMSSGWNLLTLKTADRDPDISKAFFEFAGNRPGFRRKILMVPGRDLCAASGSMEMSSLSALVVFRAEDSTFPDNECTTRLSAIRPDLPVLFLVSPGLPGMSFVLYQAVPSSSKEYKTDSNMSPNVKTAFFQGRLLTFLHLQRFPISFVESRTTFKKGCMMLPSGPWVIAFVSGQRAEGYCPLFLKSSGELYRAVDVRPNAGCDYGVTSESAIRCQ